MRDVRVVLVITEQVRLQIFIVEHVERLRAKLEPRILAEPGDCREVEPFCEIHVHREVPWAAEAVAANSRTWRVRERARGRWREVVQAWKRTSRELPARLLEDIVAGVFERGPVVRNRPQRAD